MRNKRSFHLVLLLFGLAVFCAVTAIASPAQVTTLANFDFYLSGASPNAPLIQAFDGNFYGTTEQGGAHNGGTVFKVTPTGALTVLYHFCSKLACIDGSNPEVGLAQGADGNFYGTTPTGGAYNLGTVFKITPSGKLTTLYSFCSQSSCIDGREPSSGLTPDAGGTFYGTTDSGGAKGDGTVFKITPSGVLTTLYSFNFTDGSNPRRGLVQATDGNFYGITTGGGAKEYGTVFKITPSGVLTTLYSFCSQTNCTDGSHPYAGLVQATDGNFYGTTLNGGANGDYGTIFRITPGGTLTRLYSFCSQKNCTDGLYPEDGLVQGSDGNFYGATSQGGAADSGTIFVTSSGGFLVTLYNFCSQANCTDGSAPAGLVQGIDGNFYGTTVLGGAFGNCGSDGCGTVFSLSLGFVLSPLEFVRVKPCRLVDTRRQNGGSGPIQGGTFRILDLPQLAQQKGCADLSAAAAYSLNSTVVPQGPLGYLTIWPTGRSLPVASTMNSVDGRVKANAAIVPAGAGAAINAFASNTTDLVLDIDGYFAPAGNSTLQFYALPPCRVIDTRNANDDLKGPYLSGGVARDFPILESNCFPQGVSPQAYSFNFTAVPHGPLGYLTVWPAGQTQPVVSTLNAPTGTTVANAAIVPAGTDGAGGIEVFASNDTDLVVDVNGYFAAPGLGLSLYPVLPCRVLDTRNENGAFVKEILVDTVDSACGPSNLAQAYVFNATVVPQGPLGYLTLWPDGGQQPLVSTLNAIDGAVTSNMAIVPTTNGKIDAFASNPTQLILDISAYFAP